MTSLDPSTLSSQALWLRADLLAGSHGDLIQTWADQSGRGMDATQATESLRPALDKTGFSKPVVTFANDYMSLSRPFEDDWTCFIILATTDQTRPTSDWVQNNGILSTETTGVVNDWGITLDGGSPSVGTGNPDVSTRALFDISDGRFHLLTIRRNKTSGLLELYVDGALKASATRTTASLNAGATALLGTIDTTNGRYYLGSIAEIFATSTVLSDGDRSGVEEYYSIKYRIDLNTTIVAVVSEGGAGTGIKAMLDLDTATHPTWYTDPNFDDSSWGDPFVVSLYTPLPGGDAVKASSGQGWAHWHYFRQKFTLPARPATPLNYKLYGCCDDQATIYLDGVQLWVVPYSYDGNQHLDLNPADAPDDAVEHLLAVKNDGGMAWGALAGWRIEIIYPGYRASLAFKLVIR